MHVGACTETVAASYRAILSVELPRNFDEPVGSLARDASYYSRGGLLTAKRQEHG